MRNFSYFIKRLIMPLSKLLIGTYLVLSVSLTWAAQVIQFDVKAVTSANKNTGPVPTSLDYHSFLTWPNWDYIANYPTYSPNKTANIGQGGGWLAFLVEVYGQPVSTAMPTQSSTHAQYGNVDALYFGKLCYTSGIGKTGTENIACSSTTNNFLFEYYGPFSPPGVFSVNTTSSVTNAYLTAYLTVP